MNRLSAKVGLRKGSSGLREVREEAAGYAGRLGVGSTGDHAASPWVAPLLSASVMLTALAGRHALQWYRASQQAARASAKDT